MQTNEYLKELKENYKAIEVPSSRIENGFQDFLSKIGEKPSQKKRFRMFFYAFAVLLILVTGGVGYAKAQVAKPGEALYPLRQFSDQVRVAISGDDEKGSVVMPEEKGEVKGLEVPPKPVKKKEVEQDLIKHSEAPVATASSEIKKVEDDKEKARGDADEKEEDEEKEEEERSGKIRDILKKSRKDFIERINKNNRTPKKR